MGIVLRLTQAAAGDGQHVVTTRLTGLPGQAEASATSRFELSITDEDRERIRWYLEDFLEYPLDPAPTIAANVEGRLAEIGTRLFELVFAGDEARELWAGARGALHTARVEVACEVDAAAMLPWELLRDPRTDRPVALEAAEYVRVNAQPAKRVPMPEPDHAERLRVLLVICRPGGGDDVPFRSVGALLLKTAQAREILDLTVLRPPTFAALSTVLEQAHAAGRPFHVVHFDGHGTYLPASRLRVGGGVPIGAARYGLLSPLREGTHGYLLFEDPTTPGNQQLVDGPALGALLARTGVGVLLLNACRSAYAEAADRPRTDQADDLHALVRGYGSFALEVSDAGVAGVVAMRYSVYVVTAAQFVADLYAALLAGRSLGGAVSMGRRQLAAQPNRSIAFDPRPLQDWSVPVVYETAPVTLLRAAPDATRDAVQITVGRPDARLAGAAVAGLPPGPEVGFFGRDETLLALDRAFDTHRIVLLHAYAGSGKTSTAVEFARWYAETGGLTDPASDAHGPVLFSSLEQHTPLVALLNQLGATFDPVLQANGVQWLSLSHAERRQVALQLLAQVPVLWIWDNVEPVAGFPAGTPSAWTADEQHELRDFLHAVSRTRARLLLTSRRDERGWLGDLPIRVRLPRMPMRERIQFTQGLAARHGHRITDVADWRPLLRYSDGNPLTITLVVGQALRAGYTTNAQIEGFVARLRAGEADLDDADEAQGRSRSLAASLTYGLTAAFTEPERTQLAVLSVFQDTVDVDVLVVMGIESNPSAVPALAGLTREAGLGLLDRAAEIGLLTALGGGYYAIHPALPWFFRRLNAVDEDPDAASRAQAAYTFAVAGLGDTFHRLYREGRAEMVDSLRVEEANLLHARSLARAAGRWDDVISCMQGLSILYEHTGRGAEWARLVDELIPDLVDADTGGPRPGLAEEWGLLTDYRVGIAQDGRDWTAALQLQQARVEHDERETAVALATAPDQRTETDRRRIRNLSVSVEALGHILREQKDPGCVTHYERAADLARAARDRKEEGVIAFNLGHAHLNIPSLRDLDRAEHWYRRDLDLTDEQDHLGRARTVGQLGRVALERFLDASAAAQPAPVLLEHLNAAAAAYTEALALLPADAVPDLAVTHHHLGVIYAEAGEHDAALTHYQKSIRLKEVAGNRFSAGQTRFAVAIFFYRAGRVGDALLYARASLADFESYGGGATANIERVQQFIALLDPRVDPTPMERHDQRSEHTGR
ncbi:tetratricopeptide repeat protein [Krasilnikovia cinnamomea]|uniref:Tetratricopeptide repeat protein n=1 Tax=Krasilnikovia cinnamomea TaxID=349313 RepID=A0A4Q7ZQ79_9ACTN|nr:CHAT domain-containing protein [Krasilnikovia cinnamomea]RZU52519.1 tetratricopeptide repeat protein [Krasilnikovia cinnamomea]